MNILAISDTHGFHKDIKDFTNIDMIIFAGDFSNSRIPSINLPEADDFFNWFSEIPVKHKIMIAGNHDSAMEAKIVKVPKDIIYLEHEWCDIDGIKIFGSPYTPTFGNWSFMKKRGELDPYWQEIPIGTDILVTHGPPHGILDVSRDRDGILEFCGDKELLNNVYRVQPKYHIFGHIHSFQDCINKGYRKINDIRTIFYNASCVTDRKFDYGCTSKGYIINYNG